MNKHTHTLMHGSGGAGWASPGTVCKIIHVGFISNPESVYKVMMMLHSQLISKGIIPSASSANFFSTCDNVDESQNVQEMLCEQ